MTLGGGNEGVSSEEEEEEDEDAEQGYDSAEERAKVSWRRRCCNRQNKSTMLYPSELSKGFTPGFQNYSSADTEFRTRGRPHKVEHQVVHVALVVPNACMRSSFTARSAWPCLAKTSKQSNLTTSFMHQVVHVALVVPNACVRRLLQGWRGRTWHKQVSNKLTI